MMSFKDFLKETNRDYTKFKDQLSNICAKRSFVLKTLGKVNNYEIYSVTINPKIKKAISVTATIHGDEPAGGLGILKFLEESPMPKRLRIFTIPVLNPYGFENNERLNKSGQNINRQFNKPSDSESEIIAKVLESEKVMFLLNIHEDDGSKGFYLYHSDRSKSQQYKNILEIAKKYFPINEKETIRGDKSRKGVIFVPKHAKDSAHVNSLEFWAFHQGIPYVCSETPGKYPIEDRINCNKEIIEFISKLLA